VLSVKIFTHALQHFNTPTLKTMNIGILCYPTFAEASSGNRTWKSTVWKSHHIHFITYSQPVRLDHFLRMFLSRSQCRRLPGVWICTLWNSFDQQAGWCCLVWKAGCYSCALCNPHASVAYMAKQILAAQGYHVPFVTTLHGTDITLVGKTQVMRLLLRLPLIWAMLSPPFQKT